MDIKVGSGKVHVKDIYADQSSFTIQKGLVHLGNCHRDAKVKVVQGGQLTVGKSNLYCCIKDHLKYPFTLKYDVVLNSDTVGDDFSPGLDDDHKCAKFCVPIILIETN